MKKDTTPFHLLQENQVHAPVLVNVSKTTLNETQLPMGSNGQQFKQG